MLKKYKHSVLIDGQIRWIVNQNVEGKLKNEKIAYAQGNFYKGGTADIFCIEKEWKVAGLEENRYYFIGFFCSCIVEDF